MSSSFVAQVLRADSTCAAIEMTSTRKLALRIATCASDFKCLKVLTLFAVQAQVPATVSW